MEGAAATNITATTSTSTPAPQGSAPASTPAAPSAPPTASAQLVTPQWYESFKSPELKTYVQERKINSPEDLATRYQNLEKLKGVPEDRLLKLPEKMEGDAAKAVWQKLGAPKEAKEYGIPREEGKDTSFADWAEQAFFANNLTKSQAEGVLKSYSELNAQLQAKQQEAYQNSIRQADEKLKSEWGASYEQNLNLAKQGARILGIDAKTIDLLEKTQGREHLFKTLQKIGVSVGESNFVQGNPAPTTDLTPEQAQGEIQKLMTDQKFMKKFNKGDVETMERWNRLNQLAAPGTKSIG